MITLTVSAYKVGATHMVDGYDAEFEVDAMDSGEAMDKVERGGVFAANYATVCAYGWSSEDGC